MQIMTYSLALVLFYVFLQLNSNFAFAMNEETTDGTIYSGVWFPSASSTKQNLDSDFLKTTHLDLNRIAKDELKKRPVIIKKIGLVFPSDGRTISQNEKKNLFTLVISRATDTVFNYKVNQSTLIQHFFNITVSLIIINPLNGRIEYSRILTGELPVLEEREISRSMKKQYFLKSFRKTIARLLDKTENEFVNTTIGAPLYAFQVTHFKIKEKADILYGFQDDLKQYLHDVLVELARKNDLKIHFLPPYSQWEAETWEQFKINFNIDADVEKPLDRAESLLKYRRLLTISGILAKLSKAFVKGNKIDAYYLYIAYTAGAVVERNIAGERLFLYPQYQSREKQILNGNGSVEYHEIIGHKSLASPTALYLDAAQRAITDLAKQLILNCKIAHDEKVSEV